MQSASPSSTPPPARVIKRYANRKLYDTRESRYVTLQQLGQLIREGEDIRIIDNQSKDDLTKVTLAQIIYEEEKAGDNGRSIGSLKRLIEQGAGRLIDTLREGPRDVRAFVKDQVGELQRIADDRVRGLLSAAAHQVEQLQGEVNRLHRRIEELESRLAERRPHAGDSDKDVE